ncbi:hypothetical protein BABINDRAFT_160838 [Babjeviella inositovora NRRL Y-12698]|uniref:Uncharacterized protein n=1 Tax=Babjeviella inositovora NRRL Y-12698 TaxID=984486 RepID=A0A1E3QS89_9ASCO|nr:uncharacterized protein BABINDRAFT_160838 [Babjeviella inositovora NRRL Y-12698]ODQ80576.1 hypothetical protein BABINDRAFT_160838 [Babjeviella inositovora NRRL Y-12698]
MSHFIPTFFNPGQGNLPASSSTDRVCMERFKSSVRNSTGVINACPGTPSINTKPSVLSGGFDLPCRLDLIWGIESIA